MHSSVKGMVVHLPPQNGKDTPSSKPIPPDESSLQSLVKENEVLEGPNNNLRQEKSRDDFLEGFEKERRRHSFPSDTPKKEEHEKVKRCTSATLPRLQEEKRKFSPGNGKFTFFFNKLLESLLYW